MASKGGKWVWISNGQRMAIDCERWWYLHRTHGWMSEKEWQKLRQSTYNSKGGKGSKGNTGSKGSKGSNGKMQSTQEESDWEEVQLELERPSLTCVVPQPKEMPLKPKEKPVPQPKEMPAPPAQKSGKGKGPKVVPYPKKKQPRPKVVPARFPTGHSTVEAEKPSEQASIATTGGEQLDERKDEKNDEKASEKADSETYELESSSTSGNESCKKKDIKGVKHEKKRKTLKL